MKRVALLRHLARLGCEVLREGGSHTLVVNRRDPKVSTVPRHREIDDLLARKICRDLGVLPP